VVVGAILGHHEQRLDEVQLDALPMCISLSHDACSFRVSFAIDF
jgi:hypothetical protein